MSERDRARRTRRRQGQEGAVLLVVMLLIIMFIGLGVLAMNHTRSEMRATMSYLDATQAENCAEAVLLM